VTIHALGYQAARARLQFLDTVPLDRETAARGALAGAVAAGVWAAQSPLDTRVFRWPYLDQELLGKLVTRGRGWLPVGVALHVANGALFGAGYAHVAPRLPGPVWARGPLAGLAEHLATWPLTGLVDRHHPARGELPRLAAESRAFVQATWRHLLFGAVLGELERRLNPPAAPPPVFVPATSSNGHGNIEHAAAGAKR
jgi:hypothetical protein